MKKNSGTIDRIIRVILAVMIAIFIFTDLLNGLPAVILGIFALILILTGILGLCPFYQLLGLHTLRTKISHDS